MSKRIKITMGAAAVMAGVLAAATLPAIAQQAPFQPYNGQPSNGTTGPHPFVPYDGNGQIPNGPIPFNALPQFQLYTGNNGNNYNPACDRNSRYYNPYQCR